MSKAEQTCARKGCTRPAAWLPRLVFFASHAHSRHTPAKSDPVAELAACASCKDVITVDDLITDAGWQQIVGAFHEIKKAAPVRSRTQLEWVPLQ